MTTDIVMGEAFDLACRELDSLIDRRFAAKRTMTVERESAEHWIAELSGNVLYRSPDRNAVVRFALAFVKKTPGVEIHYDDAFVDEVIGQFSVRVPALRVVQ
jgi:hypothetical protein